MANSHDIRRLAFQALYQLDARPTDDPQVVLDSMMLDQDDDARPDFTPAEKRRAFALARAAYDNRATADAFLLETAPAWPSHRQAAVDRALLRLAHHEMTTDHAPPKVVVNEAVELAKVYSTDKSPSFVNGVLDKLLKQVLKEQGESASDLSDPLAAEPTLPATIHTVDH